MMSKHRKKEFTQKSMAQSRYLGELHKGFGLQPDTELKKNARLFTTTMMQDSFRADEHDYKTGAKVAKIDLTNVLPSSIAIKGIREQGNKKKD